MPRNSPAPFTMPLSRLALRRRSLAEQKAIRIIRGERSRRDGDPAAYAGHFKRLRTLAAKNGLVIRVPGAPYLGEDEMRILAWIAQAQRANGHAQSFHDVAGLNPTIVHCARTLDALDIHLPLLVMLAEHMVPPPTSHTAASENGVDD